MPLRATIAAIMILILASPGLRAQKKWTLEDCISYAVSNNIQLKRQMLLTENERVNLSKSRMELVPDLNLQSDARIGFGRSVNPVTNLITFKQNVSNSYSISTSVALFSGFANLNAVSAGRFMVKAGIENEKILLNTLILDIFGAYYQVLYTGGLEAAAKVQLELSEKQLFRITRNVEAGREALSKQFEMESRVSEDRLSYTMAHNSANQALTTLKQILQLGPGTPFEVEWPDLTALTIAGEGFDTDSIYAIASEVLPRLRAINYELMASHKQLAAYRGSIFPSITAGGSVFTGFYKVIEEGAAEQDSFLDQLNNNTSQMVYMSLRIPIFNNYVNGRNIRLARIRENDIKLKLELEKNNLYTEIENACLEYNRGRDEFIAARSNYDYNRKSYEVVEKKFESGLVDVTDYSAASANLFRAETEALRTKLQMRIRQLSVRFYCTGDYQQIFDNK